MIDLKSLYKKYIKKDKQNNKCVYKDNFDKCSREHVQYFNYCDRHIPPFCMDQPICLVLGCKRTSIILELFDRPKPGCMFITERRMLCNIHFKMSNADIVHGWGIPTSGVYSANYLLLFAKGIGIAKHNINESLK